MTGQDAAVSGLTCDRLGAVEVVKLAGDVVTVTAGRPAPPGTRLELREGAAALVQGKVVSLRTITEAPARWEVEVKLFSATRAARARLGKELR